MPTATTGTTDEKNIVWHAQSVPQASRWALSKHKGCVCWFTGLSGAGKSSIANQVEVYLNNQGIRTYLLDGDNIRHGLCSDLGFSKADRSENIRRVSHTAHLLADAGVVVLAALISPYRQDRDPIRTNLQQAKIPFLELYVQASLETCEGRDPKGLYQLARQGKIANFTGIDDPYEAPLQPELVLDSNLQSIPDLAQETVTLVLERIKL